jgi:hypothetical protein
MKAPRRQQAAGRGLAALVLAAALTAAFPAQEREQRPTLPGGKDQWEEILKEDHKKSLADAAELLKLAGELKTELEKNDRHIVSVTSIRKTEEIERLAKRIRGRLRRF